MIKWYSFISIDTFISFQCLLPELLSLNQQLPNSVFWIEIPMISVWTQSNNDKALFYYHDISMLINWRIVWVHLTILWDWRLKAYNAKFSICAVKKMKNDTSENSGR